MRIQLKQAEVEEAINLWLGQQGINLTDKAVSISFSVTRSPTSILADVDIDNPGTVQAPLISQVAGPVSLTEAYAGNLDQPEEAPADVAGKSLFG